MWYDKQCNYIWVDTLPGQAGNCRKNRNGMV